MYGNWPDLFLQALQDTLEMTIAAGLIAFVAGLPLGLVLVA
jgi:ABC-type methionine transport system permease subunit